MRRRRPFRGAVLVGFMGSGKSVVGRELAKRLGAGFVDLDERIEASAGMTVSEIFARAGEAAFREMERDAVREAAAVPGRVIAAGGGAFLDPANRERLKGYGPVIYLEVSPETVLERLSGDRSRPLLSGAAEEKERAVRELMARRDASYRMADFTVRADGGTVAWVVDRVAELLRRGGEG